jgi:hypothetical protein
LEVREISMAAARKLEAIPADAAEQLAVLDGEIDNLRGQLAGLGVLVETAERKMKDADAAWHTAESRIVRICRLLGVDYLCEEPETCEQVIERMKEYVSAARSLVLGAECKTADKDEILEALEGATA